MVLVFVFGGLILAGVAGVLIWQSFQGKPLCVSVTEALGKNYTACVDEVVNTSGLSACGLCACNASSDLSANDGDVVIASQETRLLQGVEMRTPRVGSLSGVNIEGGSTAYFVFDRPVEFASPSRNYKYHVGCDSNSMTPALDCNSTLILVEPRQGEVGVGDIVLFEMGDDWVAHRVVGVADEAFVTKGDNNFVIDPGVRTFGSIKYVVAGIIYG